MNGSSAQTLMTFLPLAVIALIMWALAKWAAPIWALLLALILGVALSGTILGPEISRILPLVSGGYLH